jgi:chitin synthase
MPFALRNTYAHFKRNPYCGGLTGELRVERPYRNFLTSVQYMEWKVRYSWGRYSSGGIAEINVF